jgi:hypothetical protein
MHLAVALLCLGLFALLTVFLWVNSVFVFNSIRYMATAPSVPWREIRYLRALPNILKCLYDAGFPSPWPARPTALAAIRFRSQLNRLLAGSFPDAPVLVQQHLALWAFVQFHRDDFCTMIHRLQVDRAHHILAESPNIAARQKALAFLMGHKGAHSNSTLTEPLISKIDASWLTRLRSLNALLVEHGYSLCDELTLLARWEAPDAEALMEDLFPSNRHTTSS